jgi:hypothetical protein
MLKEEAVKRDEKQKADEKAQLRKESMLKHEAAVLRGSSGPIGRPLPADFPEDEVIEKRSRKVMQPPSQNFVDRYFDMRREVEEQKVRREMEFQQNNAAQATYLENLMHSIIDLTATCNKLNEKVCGIESKLHSSQSTDACEFEGSFISLSQPCYD